MNDVINVSRAIKPWDAVYILAQESDPRSWMLVGGLMVQAYARMNGREFRHTADADFLVDIMSDKLGANHIARILERHGYQLLTETLSGYTNRMEKPDGEKVDLLVADHLPKWVENRRLAHLGSNHMFSAPGGAQACERYTEVTLRDDLGEYRIRIPDQLGALMLKAAAWEVDRSEARARHLMDAVLLCAMMEDPDAERARLHSKNDYRRLLRLRDDMMDDSLYLDMFSSQEIEDAHDAIEILTAGL